MMLVSVRAVLSLLLSSQPFLQKTLPLLLTGVSVMTNVRTTQADEASNSNGESSAKTVYLIRHAESEENRRLLSLKSTVKSFSKFSLPNSKDVKASFELMNVWAQVDSELSDVGRKQIEYMARILEETNFLVNSQIELVAHSPLLRAKQTAKGMLGCMAPDIRTHPVVRVEEIDLLTEKTPAEWIPGNYGSFAKRMADLEEWLEKQPEKTVALVGHSQFFKAMLQLDYKFGNCDVMHVQFDARNGNGAPASKWSDLKKIHACKVPEQPETKSIN